MTKFSSKHAPFYFENLESMEFSLLLEPFLRRVALFDWIKKTFSHAIGIENSWHRVLEDKPVLNSGLRSQKGYFNTHRNKRN